MNYNEHRDKALAWMNGRQDFLEGIEILRASGFRPVVVKVLARQGVNAPAGKQRLLSIMRDLVRVWADKSLSDDTNIDMGVENGKELGSAQEPEKAPGSIFEAAERLDQFPESVGAIITKYRDSYMRRDKLMRELAEVGESNDPESIDRRKALSDAIKVESDLQDKLYPYYAKFLENGEIPTVGEAEVEGEGLYKSRVNIEREAKDLSTMSKAELQKLRKSLATKVIRARNMLLYQTETAGDVENPIPAGDVRRTKYESKIERLSARIKEVDFQLAKLA